MLYVPDITKNLLSISKLTHDNNIIIEFDVDCCFVKDKMTRKAHLRGKLTNGLYQLLGSDNQFNDPRAYISIKER